MKQNDKKLDQSDIESFEFVRDDLVVPRSSFDLDSIFNRKQSTFYKKSNMVTPRSIEQSTFANRSHNDLRFNDKTNQSMGFGDEN